MSHRIPQLNSLIKKELGRAFLDEIELPAGALTTIMKVETTHDLNQAKIWVSVLPQTHRAVTLRALQKQRTTLQSFLNRRLVLRKIPRLIFCLDTSEEKAARINKLLDQIAAENK